MKRVCLVIGAGAGIGGNVARRAARSPLPQALRPRRDLGRPCRRRNTPRITQRASRACAPASALRGSAQEPGPENREGAVGDSERLAIVIDTAPGARFGL
jgi:hypothetical protein